VFLQEKELGSALALKTIPGEAVGFWAVTPFETITNATIAPSKRAVTELRRISIAGSPRVLDFDFLGVNCNCSFLREPYACGAFVSS
jgi:hypothetical protein